MEFAEIWYGNELVTYKKVTSKKEGNIYYKIEISGEFVYNRIELYDNNQNIIGIWEGKRSLHNGTQEHVLIKAAHYKFKHGPKEQTPEQKREKQKSYRKQKYIQKNGVYL